MIALRPYLAADAPVLALIFRDSVEACEDYDDGQRAAWAAAAQEPAFGAKLAADLTLVATLEGAPQGFASLRGKDEIAMLYVHPDAQGQGLAAALVDALEKLARARGATRISVDASENAEALFFKRGYVGLRRNTKRMGDEWLGDTTMQKDFTP